MRIRNLELKSFGISNFLKSRPLDSKLEPTIRCVSSTGTISRMLRHLTWTACRSLSTTNSALLGLSTRVSSAQRLLSSSVAAAPSSRVVPPNLRFDPRSSFAPKAPTKVVSIRDDDDENYEEEVDDDLDEKLSRLPKPELRYAVPLPDRLNVSVHTLFSSNDTKVGTLWLEESVFGRDPIRIDLLKRSVDYYRNKLRGVRKAVTKTISQVSGSGRKLRNQKGQGRARVGHSRPAHFRGGAKAHGPKNVTDYGATKLNKRVRKLALTHALSQKLKEGNLIVVDQLHALPTHKTKELVRLLAPFGIAGSSADNVSTALLLDHYYPSTQTQDEQPVSYQGVPIHLWVASNNIPKLTVGNDNLANVYSILKHEKLVLTLDALQKIEGRLKDI